MAQYTQVYKDEVYKFDSENSLFEFTAKLDKEGVSYSTTVNDGFTVTIL